MNETDTPLPPPDFTPVKKQMRFFSLPLRTIMLALGLIVLVLFLDGRFGTRNYVKQAIDAAESMEGRDTAQNESLEKIDDRFAHLENRVGVLENRPEATIVSATKTAANSVPTNMDIARLQSDIVAMSSALSNLQAQVKRNDTLASEARLATQALLGSALAFIQLREAAASGRSFASELAAMREAGRNDPGTSDALAQLAPYADKGAPSLAALHDELVLLEVPASNAISKAEAQGWFDKLLVELKSLVIIRPLHGSIAADPFTVIESDCAKGDLKTALANVGILPPEAQRVLNDWRAKAEMREKIDAALRTLVDHFTVPTASQDKP